MLQMKSYTEENKNIKEIQDEVKKYVKKAESNNRIVEKDKKKCLLREIKFSNIYSYGENNTINLEKNKIIGMCGKNKSGKTAVLIAMLFTAYGPNSMPMKNKYAKKALVNVNKTSCRGKIVFNINKDEHVIIRKYTSEQKDKKDKHEVTYKKNNKDVTEGTVTNTDKKIIKDIGGYESFMS